MLLKLAANQLVTIGSIAKDVPTRGGREWSLLPDQIAQQARGDRELRKREAGARNLVDRAADAIDLALACRNPRFDRGRTRGAVLAFWQR